MSNKEYIHNEVHKFRKGRKETQEELAQQLQVSRQTIISIEKGKYTPSVMLALKISHHFGVPLEDIFSISTD